MEKTANKFRPNKIFGGIFYALKMYRQRKALGFAAFSKKVQQAEKMAAENNKRYRIYSFDGKYHILSRDDINFLRNRNLLSRKIEIGVYDRFCLYDTLTHANLHPQFRERELHFNKFKIDGN